MSASSTASPRSTAAWCRFMDASIFSQHVARWSASTRAPRTSRFCSSVIINLLWFAAELGAQPGRRSSCACPSPVSSALGSCFCGGGAPVDLNHVARHRRVPTPRFPAPPVSGHLFHPPYPLVSAGNTRHSATRAFFSCPASRLGEGVSLSRWRNAIRGLTASLCSG